MFYYRGIKKSTNRSTIEGVLKMSLKKLEELSEELKVYLSLMNCACKFSYDSIFIITDKEACYRIFFSEEESKYAIYGIEEYHYTYFNNTREVKEKMLELI